MSCLGGPLPRSSLALVLSLATLCALSLCACGAERAARPGDSDTGDLQADAEKDAATHTAKAGQDAGKQPNKDAGAGRDAGTLDDDGKSLVTEDPSCAGITKTAPVIRGKVDVIWLIDNSPSMFDKVLQVAANMADFFSTIQSSGVDTHVVTLTIADPASGTPLATDADKYRFVAANVWSGLVYATATSAYPSYQDFMRPEASTHVVVVSDDNDLIAPADFAEQFKSQLGHDFTLHAIVADQFGCGAQVGENYLTLADQTMGEKISVCSQDWTQVFGDLQDAVIQAAPLPCSYDLADAAKSADMYDSTAVQVKYTPDGSDKHRELPKSPAQDKCGDQPGWYYDSDSDPKVIHLCPAACTLAQQGGAMDIAFGCKPTILL